LTPKGLGIFKVVPTPRGYIRIATDSIGGIQLTILNSQFMTDKPIQPSLLQKILSFFESLWKHLLALYHPQNLKRQGLIWSIELLVVTVLILMFSFGMWWTRAPSVFDVQAVAQQRAERHNEKIVAGYITTSTLIEVINILLNKSGGYLSNDIMSPSLFMDDMPNWEWGVLQQVREFSKALRNDMSRSRNQSEDADLAKAEPKFNTDNKSWFWPASENAYQEGIDLLEKYLHRLAAPDTAQFLVSVNNLRDWLGDVSKRLGSLSHRLSTSVGQKRITPIARNDTNTEQLTPASIENKTSWTKIDDVFYEARGTSWALIHLLRAIEIDFKDVLEKKHATIILRQVIRELETTQKAVWSPMILNGSEFGLFANHSLVLSSYISRANMGIIELHNLLENG